jgi:hypothetical protein
MTIKVLVATKETQGERKNDFFFANEGELVGFCSECDGGGVDDKCGCHRSMSGFESNKATTTMKVVEMNITKDEFAKKLRESLEKSGWLKLMTKKEADAWVKEDTDVLLVAIDPFPVGSIVEKRGDKIQSRTA